MAEMDRASKRNIVEVVLVFIVIATFLWFGRRSFPGANPVFAVILLAILVYAHQQAGEGFREIGFRWDTFATTGRLLLPVMLIGGTLIIAAALALDGNAVSAVADWVAQNRRVRRAGYRATVFARLVSSSGAWSALRVPVSPPCSPH